MVEWNTKGISWAVIGMIVGLAVMMTGCILDDKFYPMFVLIPYMFMMIPFLLTQKGAMDYGQMKPGEYFGHFFAGAMITSTFALHIVLVTGATPLISGTNFVFAMIGNLVTFGSVGGYLYFVSRSSGF